MGALRLLTGLAALAASIACHAETGLWTVVSPGGHKWTVLPSTVDIETSESGGLSVQGLVSVTTDSGRIFRQRFSVSGCDTLAGKLTALTPNREIDWSWKPPVLEWVQGEGAVYDGIAFRICLAMNDKLELRKSSASN